MAVARCCPSTLARMKAVRHLRVISERTYDNGSSSTNGSLDLSLPFQWNETRRSITADAISRVGLAVPYIVSTWCIHKTKSGHGILWWPSSVSHCGHSNDKAAVPVILRNFITVLIW